MCWRSTRTSSSSSPGVRRVFVVDPATRRVQAVVSLSDVAAYLFPGVAEAAAALVAETGAEVVVLCGAAMAGMPPRIADRVSVPVIHGIASGVGMAEMLVRLRVRKALTGSLAHPGERPTIGLAAPLAALLRGGD